MKPDCGCGRLPFPTARLCSYVLHEEHTMTTYAGRARIGSPRSAHDAGATHALLRRHDHPRPEQNRLRPIVVPLFDGPQLRTVAIHLEVGVPAEKVEKIASAVALAAHSSTCRIARDHGKLLVEVPKAPEERRKLGAAAVERFTAAELVACGIGAVGDGPPHVLVYRIDADGVGWNFIQGPEILDLSRFLHGVEPFCVHEILLLLGA